MGSLEDYEGILRSKIGAINGGLESLNELENVYREAKKILNDYERVLEQSSHYSTIYPKDVIAKHRQTFKSLIAELHKAILTARSELSTKRSVKSKSLLTNRATPSSSQPAQDPVDSLAQEISNSLQEMSKTMQDELLRSETSFQIMQSSTKRLRVTAESYGVFGGLIGKSKGLIGGLWKRERSDRRLIMMALIGYGLALGYVAWKRLWLGKFLLPIIKLLISWTGSVSILIYKMLFGSKSVKIDERSPLPMNMSEGNLEKFYSSNITEPSPIWIESPPIVEESVSVDHDL